MREYHGFSWPRALIPQDPYSQIFLAGALIALLVIIIFASTLNFAPKNNEKENENPSTIEALARFVYGCFLKPHEGDGSGSQQDALESFYKAQAGIYDATRSALLRGREDMLGLVAAQLLYKATKARSRDQKRIWVDVGGGTGYNIEAMSAFVSVPEFFSAVYLVDFSPSLCEVARKRFARLGWKNVKVICQDARLFRLEEHESSPKKYGRTRSSSIGYFNDEKSGVAGADLITMSYSLSMIPDFYSVVDSITNLLAPDGIVGVVDFYVQSQVDLSFRNYTGGTISRHVNWFARLFWRAWFDLDRVGLEAGRRDYLEYRFGTVLSLDSRNKRLGGIPYYCWIGAQKMPASEMSPTTPGGQHDIVSRLDAQVTESPYLYPVNHTKALSQTVDQSVPEIRSKAFDAAVLNLSSNLPLPAFFYQNHHWRIHYDDQLKKHTQFKNEYIYAFTWEDARVDDRILKITNDDVILAITSAGDNILSYALSQPARIHAVDLNPTQNNLLELKVAAFSSLPYQDFWQLFGIGKHPDFRGLLISHLSPHLSSRAFQYWLNNIHVFSPKSVGLYGTGGSRHALRVFRVLSTLLGLRTQVNALLNAKTLNEQKEIYFRSIRPVFLSRILSYLLIQQESFLWAALGVPHNQLAVLENDYIASETEQGRTIPPIGTKGAAVWHYVVNTLDPVATSTLIGEDNPYYLVCLNGEFTERCQLAYQTPKAHAKLSKPGAFDGLRIHTDEIQEVVARLTPGSLTIAVVMDSMDWFDPGAQAAAEQIEKLNRAMKMGGRVLLRSAGLSPWYLKEFERLGFSPKRVGTRTNGTCIDRVNMYASTWLVTKVADLPPNWSRESSVDEKLVI